MHASSYENMQLCYEKYVCGTFLESRDNTIVLDIGSSNVNGSYRPIFSSPKLHYIGADLSEGAGVDLVMRDPYKIPLPDASVDVVLSGQMLEHCEFFWLAFTEMCRVLKPDGFLFLIAPSSGEIHRYPVDCYRFLPDSFHALAKYANCILVDVWRDERGPWRDLVGVFRRSFSLDFPERGSIIQGEPFYCDATRPECPGPREAERVSEGVNYLEVLALIHDALAPRGYLEIGVRQGHSLALARASAIGIDPAANVTQKLQTSTKLINSTSDDFFRYKKQLDIPIDLAFIDGMHAFEYALRDFINIETHSNASTLVVIDDIFPNHPLQAARRRQTLAWTGDVWKLLPCLRAFRPDLTLVTIDCSPTGLLLVAGLNSRVKRLWVNYNDIVKRYVSPEHPDNKHFAVPPISTLDRIGALKPYDSRLKSLCSLLKSARENSMPMEMIHDKLADWRSS